MADNVTTQATTLASAPSGTVFGFDEVDGVKIARSKTGFGADGSYSDVSSSDPLPVVATALGTLTGAVDETAPASDTASSGLNGRLQRIAQRLSTIIGLLPTSLGAGGGLKVDGSGTALPVSLSSLPALAAGTNAIGKLAANSGVDIGDVDVTSLPALAAGTNHVGGVTARLGQTRIVVTPTISTSLYTTGDAVGGKLTFANAARSSGGSITITAALIVDKDQELAPLELVLFNDDFTAVSDNATFDPTDADLASKFIGVVKVSDYSNFSDNAVATRECRLPATLVGTSLYGQLVVRGAPTYTATDDIIVVVQVAQD